MDIGDVTVDRRGVSLWVLRLAGEHDLSNVSQLRAALDDAGDSGSSVIVDLGECEFIDSTVMATLISARDRILEDGGRFAVVTPEGSFNRNVLTIVGVAAASQRVRLARPRRGTAGGTDKPSSRNRRRLAGMP